MNLKILINVLLIPCLTQAQSLAPAPSRGARPADRTKLSIFKKPKIQMARPLLVPLQYQETQIRLMDQATYVRFNRFLFSNYSMGKNSLSSEDKLLGIMGGVASGVCAGVAAVQWIEAQDKNGKKAGSKPANPAAKAKTI